MQHDGGGFLDAATARSVTGGARSMRGDGTVDIPVYQVWPVQRWLRNDNSYRARWLLEQWSAESAFCEPQQEHAIESQQQ